MKKKIDLFWYWFIFVVAFVLCFFAINNKKVNAYSLDSNGNIISSNLFNINNSQYRSEKGFRVELIDNKYYVYNADSNGRFIDFTLPILEKNKNYTLSLNVQNATFDNIQMYFTNNIGSEQYQNGYTYQLPFTFNYNNIGSYKYVFCELYLTNPTNDVIVLDIMLNEGDIALPYEPYGMWYSESNAENKFQGRLPSFTSSLTYEDGGSGQTLSINNLNSYIDNSFGYLYFNRVWTYLDNLAIDGYSNARLTINFKENLNINTTYIFNSTKDNYGSGVWFYQDDNLMLDVRNFYDSSYCGGAVEYSCNVELNKYVNVGNGTNSFSYLNKIVVWSNTTDKRTLSFGYNNIGYNTGYDNGYSVGYKDGKNVSDNLVYDNGYTNGYNVGYDKGVNYASNGGNTLVGLVGAVFTAPVNMLHTIFDFEFLGINLTDFLFSLISLFIVIFLIRKFL